MSASYYGQPDAGDRAARRSELGRGSARRSRRVLTQGATRKRAARFGSATLHRAVLVHVRADHAVATDDVRLHEAAALIDLIGELATRGAERIGHADVDVL